MRKVLAPILLLLAIATSGCISDRHEQFVRQDARFGRQTMPRAVALLKMLGALSPAQRLAAIAAVEGSGMSAKEKETAKKMIVAAGITSPPSPLDEFVDTAEKHLKFIEDELDRIKDE